MIGKPAFYAIVAVAAIGVSGEARAGEAEAAHMSSAVLKSALRGEEISYRGRIMDGDAAAAFGEGYVFAIAERARIDGLWCGLDKLAPHETVAHVFDALPAGDAPDAANPAAMSVPDILAKIYPCNKIEGRPQ